MALPNPGPALPPAAQLTLPLVPPPSAPQGVPLVLAPDRVWSGVPPPLRGRVRQRLVELLREAVPHADR